MTPTSWRPVRLTMVALALAAVVAAATPTKAPWRGPSNCGTGFPKPQVGRPVDSSVARLFGVDTFLSSDEWDAAIGRLKAGEVAFVADGRGVEHALFVDPAPADRAHAPMLVKVAGVGRNIGREDRPRRGTWFVDYCGDGVIDRVLRY